jgi:integrase
MASVVDDPNGRKRILFVGSDGKRRAIRLGKVSAKQADAFKVKVERLVAAQIVGHPPDDETSRWLVDLDDVIHARLANVGLVQERQSLELGIWIEKYLASRVGELKPESLRKLHQTKDKLLRFFDAKTALRAITTDRAADWRSSLARKGISEATMRQHCRNAKTFFGEAVERGLIPQSPVRNLKSGVISTSNDRYVTPEQADKILAACPNLRWRLLFGLARFAGLRTPSETHLLSWGDVNWEHRRLTVRSPKTEHFAGKAQRVVPITPKLMVILQEGFDAANEGQEKIITKSRNNLRRELKAIVGRAGVPTWDDTFQTLRRSCEIEWAQRYPQFAVSQWIGHSITVSGKHYANNVPDELFEKATMAPDQSLAAQNAAQQSAESACTIPQERKVGPEPISVTLASCDNLQPVANSSDRTRTCDPGLMNPLLCQLSYAARM